MNRLTILHHEELEPDIRWGLTLTFQENMAFAIATETDAIHDVLCPSDFASPITSETVVFKHCYLSD